MAGSGHRQWHFGWAGLAAFLVALAVLHPADVRANGQEAAALELRRAESIEEYAAIQEQIGVSDRRMAELEAEIDAIRSDHAALSAALVQAAKTERKLATEIEEISVRLEDMRHRESSLKESLAERRGLLAEVLAALQRMGLNPPPALLVRPHDALASVRSAIVLGSVVPHMREETQRLVADLKALSDVRTAIGKERARLFQTVADQAAEQHRLAELLEEKRKLRGKSEAELAAERRRAEKLAAEAGSIEELVSSLESEISAAREAAARMPPPRESTLAASLPFSALKGQIPLPVPGAFASRFGDKDDIGQPMMGDTLRTHSGAIVTAPAEGSVLYAGPFRSYGQLLILNAGQGYHIVMAGMGSISVGVGQTVLAGEPVGAMEEARVASAAAFDARSDDPELYVEFRKDGNPVDPSPWWQGRSSGRTGNDA